MAKKHNDGYLSAKESRRISKENRKITNALEKKRKRKNVPESEYLTDDARPQQCGGVRQPSYLLLHRRRHGQVRGRRHLLTVPIGKTVGVVGESGCGKSVTSLSLMQLLQRPQGQVVEGEIRLNLGDKAYDVTKTPDSVDAEPAGQLRVHDLPGAHDRTEPGVPHRRPGGRGHRPPRRRRARRRSRCESAPSELLEMVGIANSAGVYTNVSPTSCPAVCASVS